MGGDLPNRDERQHESEPGLTREQWLALHVARAPKITLEQWRKTRALLHLTDPPT
jgi:hypothetical protein